MPAAGTLYQPAISAIPIASNGKGQYRASPALAVSYSRPTISPLSAASSVNTSAVPSLISGNYARNAVNDQESSNGGNRSIDLIDMMTDRLGNAVNPIPLDRTLARQAQTSGELNAKQRELAELQALAQRRLRGTRANLADGIKAAKEVHRDLEWTQNRVSNLNAKAASKHPSAYRKASARLPSQNEC